MASSSLRPSAPQHAVHALRAEDAHQIVLEREEEARAAGIALAARAAAELIVDAPALMALGADHVKAAGFERLLFLLGDFGCDLARRAVMASDVGSLPFSVSPRSSRDQHVGIPAELDVGAAAGHVGGDRDGAGHAGLGDDLASCSW